MGYGIEGSIALWRRWAAKAKKSRIDREVLEVLEVVDMVAERNNDIGPG